MPTRPPVHKPPGAATPRARARAYDQDRGSKEARGYDRAWQRFRLLTLQARPLCVDCEAVGLLCAASELHHVRKVRQAPHLRLDPANVLPLCKPCHTRRTAAGE